MHYGKEMSKLAWRSSSEQLTSFMAALISPWEEGCSEDKGHTRLTSRVSLPLSCCVTSGLELNFSMSFSSLQWNGDRNFPGGSDGKEPACKCGRPGLDPWVGQIPWTRAWQPTPWSGLRIPWTQEPGRLQSLGLQRVRHDWETNTFTTTAVPLCAYRGVHVCAKLLQSCPTLCVDCSPSGFSVHGILQARKLEWVAMPSSRGYSQPRDWTWVSCIAGRFFTTELPGKSLFLSLCL